MLRKWKVELAVARHDDDQLLQLLADPTYRRSDGIAVRIVNALGRSGDTRAVDPIIAILQEERRATVRSTAAIALGRIGDPRAIQTLHLALDDNATRMWTIRSLGELRDRKSVDRLVEELKDHDWGVRQYAAGALGAIGDQSATPGLISALHDENASVRRFAATSLAELGDSRAVEPVRQAYDAATGFTKRRIGRALESLEERFG